MITTRSLQRIKHFVIIVLAKSSIIVTKSKVCLKSVYIWFIFAHQQHLCCCCCGYFAVENRDEIQFMNSCIEMRYNHRGDEDIFSYRALTYVLYIFCRINNNQISSSHSLLELRIITSPLPPYSRCPTLLHRNERDFSTSRWRESVSSLYKLTTWTITFY